MSIEVLDAVKLAGLPSLDGPAGPATRFLTSMVKNGAVSYIDNANVRMEALMIDGKLLPLVISERIEGNSNVCSAYAHYIEYAFHELAGRYRRVPAGLLKAPRSLLGALLRSGSIDRIVFVNNWLLTTNPRHGLSSAQIAALTAYLPRRYPDSAIVFRSINPLTDRPGLDALRTNGYELIPSRRVYILDTRDARYLGHRDIKRDLGKLRKTCYSIVDIPEAIASHVKRMAVLYRDLYLGKYSPLNPQYNADYFTLTLKEGFLTYRAFVEDGRLDAFVSYFVEDELMTSSLLAHDRNRPRTSALYRLTFALLIEEAAKRKVPLNMSAGAGDFKLFRGAQLVQESDAVYDRHLPIARRLPWVTVNLMTQLGRLLP